MNVHAHGPWVLVRPEKRQDVYSGVIVLETGAERVGYTIGRVVDVAERVYCDIAQREAPLHAPDFSVGDRVVYRRYLQYAHNLGTEQEPQSFIHWQDILLVVDDSVQIDLGGTV